MAEVSAAAATMRAAYGQRQLWIHDQLHGPDGTYNIPLTVRIEGSIDPEVVARALNEIVRRHEALRTTFRAEADDLLQVIAPSLTIELRRLEAPDDKPDAALAWAIGEVARDGAAPFDMVAGPLLRATLYQLRQADYVLSVVVHHSVFDGWSVGVFLAELSAIYDAFARGLPSPLPELELQFADFATWQREQVEGGSLQPAVEFWRTQLRGAPVSMALATDRARSRAGLRPGHMLRRQAPPALRAALLELSRREGATLFMVFTAALAAFLHRYTRERDLVISMPFSGRDREEIEPLIGFFVNTLLLRFTLEGDPSFREWLARTKAIVLEAHRHQDAPLDAVQHAIRVDGAEPPQIQVMIGLQNATPDPPPMGGCPTTLLWVHNGTSKFDWFLNVVDDRDGLRYELEYDSSLFDEETVSRVLDHFSALLAGAAADPATPVGSLPLIGADETRRVLREFNDPDRYPERRPAPFGASETLPAVFQRIVDRQPDAAAITGDGVSLTYRDLNEQANRVAWQLRALGVGPNVLVGVSMERGPRLVVALLAILKSGGAYLPLDLAYPAERRTFMLADAQVRVFVTERALADRLPEGTKAICFVDDALQGAASPGEFENLPSTLRSDDLAYVIYTSGTTGRPKGSQITHRNVLSLFAGTNRLFEFDHRDVWTLFHSYAFDFSVWEIWGALLHGGRLVVVAYLVSRDPEHFAALVEQESVTVLNQTPSAFRQFIQAEAARPAKCPTLRYVVLGGEALEMRGLAPWFERHGDERPAVVNMYGITETTVHVTYRRVRRSDVTSASLVGSAIPFWQVYVLEPGGQPAPIGVPGEIHVGGAGVSKGYLRRDELTAQKFIPDPFGEQGGRLYRSGDLARYRSNGDLEYIGRIDRQVKVRGFRIETGEIEAVLTDHPRVRESAVIPVPGPSDSAALVAYVVPEGGQVLDVETLRAHLRTRVPDYMVPSVFVTVPSMPLTANGKLDVAALPDPQLARRQSAGRGEAPRAGTESQLAAIWCELLDCETVSRSDSFFEVGGHSLLAMRLAHRVHEAMGVPLPLGTLFQVPVLADLAARIDGLRGIGRAEPVSGQEILVQIQAGDGGTPFYWVHGVGGEIYQYMTVSRHLAASRPVLGFSADWTRLPPEDTTSIAAVAARYVRELKARQPSGPYHLGGFCNASPLLLEMVRQLEDAGDAVGLCAAIGYDLRPVSTSPRGVRGIWRFLRELPGWIREDAWPSGRRELLGRVASRLRRFRAKLSAGADDGARAGDIRDQLGMWRFPDYAVPMLEFHQGVISRFSPRPVRGKVSIYLPARQPLFGPWLSGPHDAWKTLATGGLVEHHVAGSHFGILQDPFARDLAALMERAICDAERDLAARGAARESTRTG